MVRTSGPQAMRTSGPQDPQDPQGHRTSGPQDTRTPGTPLTSWGSWEMRLKNDRQKAAPPYLRNADVPLEGLQGCVVAITEERISTWVFDGESRRRERRERPVLWIDVEGVGRRGLVLESERLQVAQEAAGSNPQDLVGQIARVRLAPLLDRDGNATGRQYRALSIGPDTDGDHVRDTTPDLPTRPAPPRSSRPATPEPTRPPMATPARDTAAARRAPIRSEDGPGADDGDLADDDPWGEPPATLAGSHITADDDDLFDDEPD